MWYNICPLPPHIAHTPKQLIKAQLFHHNQSTKIRRKNNQYGKTAKWGIERQQNKRGMFMQTWTRHRFDERSVVLTVANLRVRCSKFLIPQEFRCLLGSMVFYCCHDVLFTTNCKIPKHTICWYFFKEFMHGTPQLSIDSGGQIILQLYFF